MDYQNMAIMAVNGAAAALVYSLIFYAKKREGGQEFDPYKFTSTIIVGVVVGVFLSLGPMELTQENVMGIMATNIGIIAVIESALKWLVRKTRNLIG